MSADRQAAEPPTLLRALTTGLADALTKDWPGDTRRDMSRAIAEYLLARPEVRAALASDKAGLDAAWTESVEALPEGWTLILAYYPTRHGDLKYEADAIGDPPRHDGLEVASGATPDAALRAVTERLGKSGA